MFSGAMTAMVTPFRDGKVDENRLREQVEFQIKGGIDVLVPVGTTGESPTLDFPEHHRVIELTVKFAAGRVPVLAGCTHNSTLEAVARARALWLTKVTRPTMFSIRWRIVWPPRPAQMPTPRPLRDAGEPIFVLR